MLTRLSGVRPQQLQDALKGSPAAWEPDRNEAWNLMRNDSLLGGVLIVMDSGC